MSLKENAKFNFFSQKLENQNVTGISISELQKGEKSPSKNAPD